LPPQRAKDSPIEQAIHIQTNTDDGNHNQQADSRAGRRTYLAKTKRQWDLAYLLDSVVAGGWSWSMR
jgi:hypothetical protein